VIPRSDTRQPGAPLHVYSETHSDDVSTLAFHPTQDHLLLSGAMDGLISTIDVRIPDEDDAILHTANVGASLSRVDWMNLPNASAGNEKTGVWGLTNMETLSVYDASDEVSWSCERSTKLIVEPAESALHRQGIRRCQRNCKSNMADTLCH
jgi:WD40 repeat protein